MAKRVYILEDLEAGTRSLYSAASKTQVINEVAKNRYSATIATHEQIIDAVQDGMKIQTLGKDGDQEEDKAEYDAVVGL